MLVVYKNILALRQNAILPYVLPIDTQAQSITQSPSDAARVATDILDLVSVENYTVGLCRNVVFDGDPRVPETKLNRRLTSLDAAFIYLENDKAPMHIGGATFLHGKIEVDAFKKNIESKLHLIPRYRQRIIVPPLNMGHPTWEFDPEFSIDNHIEAITLGKRNSDADCRRTVGRLFEGVMDRDRPLWKIYLIHGLKDGDTIMVSLVHHCMVDGVSGAELLNIIFDPLPEPKPVAKQPYDPEPLPASSKVVVDALWSNAVEQFENWSELQQNALNLAKAFRGSDVLSGLRELPAMVRDTIKPIRRLPFNTRVFSGKRKIAWSEVSFTEARGIRGAIGGTVNDVVLTTLGGAIIRYLQHHDVSIKKRQTLRVMVPVSVRREDERDAMGNRVSMLPVNVPLIEDPVERMKSVTQQTSVLKKNRVAEGLSLFIHAWQATLPPVQAALGQAVFASSLQPAIDFALRSPGLHMVCTNVPGPQIPLYALGHRVLYHYPLVPVAPGMGLNFAIFSYNQRLHFGLVADAKAMSDVHRFAQFLKASFDELREAAGVPEAEVIELKTPRTKREPAKKAPAAKRKSRAKALKRPARSGSAT